LKVSTHSNDPTAKADTPKQTSFRLPPDLYRRFRVSLEDRDLKMTSVIHELVEEWLDKPSSMKRAQYVRPYLSYLPVTAVVKDPSGRVLFGNGEFLRLIGLEKEGIVGSLPEDYVDDHESADVITKLDEAVRSEGRPILCIEHLKFNGETHHRMAIRFPIPPEGDLELTGVLGFDLEQVEDVTASLHPESSGKRLCPFATLPSTTPESPFHCLKDFLHSLPAIATVKDLDGRLLCVNTEYTKVLGKHRVEVENHLSTEIWSRSFADVIIAHDDVVRHTCQTFASVEHVPTRQGLRHRLNIRFPIFDSFKSDHKLVMTGTLGFDYELMRRGIERLKAPEPAVRAYLFLPPGEQDSLKLVYSTKQKSRMLGDHVTRSSS